VNETVAETQASSFPASGAGADDLALRRLLHVGAAYALIFALLLVFAWRTTTATRRLAERVDELERSSGQH
jgi:hypothetical protein